MTRPKLLFKTTKDIDFDLSSALWGFLASLHLDPGDALEVLHLPVRESEGQTVVTQVLGGEHVQEKANGAHVVAKDVLLKRAVDRRAAEVVHRQVGLVAVGIEAERVPVSRGFEEQVRRTGLEHLLLSVWTARSMIVPQSRSTPRVIPAPT